MGVEGVYICVLVCAACARVCVCVSESVSEREGEEGRGCRTEMEGGVSREG